MSYININQLERALKSLDSILDRYVRDNYDIDIRDAVIQCFE